MITGSSATGVACMKKLLSQAATTASSSSASSSVPALTVRGCFRSPDKVAVVRAALPTENISYSYEAHPYNVDATDIDSLHQALEGVDRALLVTPLDYKAGMKEDAAKSINMIRAALEMGVKRIVHVGSWTANAPARLPILSARFTPTEEYLETAIGDQMEWTVLRGGYFMSNFAHVHADAIRTQDELLAVPDCQIPSVDVRDMGEAAAALLGGDHDEHYARDYHKSYIECCGPDRHTHAEIAVELSAGIGRTISYPSAPNLDEWCAQTANPILLELYQYMANEQANPGHVPFDPDRFAAVLGRLPTPLRQWAADHKQAFGGESL